MAERATVRVGIVGAGWMGGLRARALGTIAGAEVVGVADLDRTRALPTVQGGRAHRADGLGFVKAAREVRYVNRGQL